MFHNHQGLARGDYGTLGAFAKPGGMLRNHRGLPKVVSYITFNKVY